MKRYEEEHEREILREAFIAGWQAALGVTIRNSAVLAVVDSCFEEWLVEAADEAEVLGLMFRGRYDLPESVLKKTPLPAHLTVGRQPPPPLPEPPEQRVNGQAVHVNGRPRENA